MGGVGQHWAGWKVMEGASLLTCWGYKSTAYLPSRWLLTLCEKRYTTYITQHETTCVHNGIHAYTQ